MATSRIEWTERTWNPVTGCAKVSAGCKHCYAERMALQLQAMAAPGYTRGFALTLHADRLDLPLGRKKSTLYFVCSMADLFHEDVPDAFIDRVLATMHRTPWHIYQFLTKRAERLPEFFASRPIPPNVWLGVTVEDRRHGLPRIDLLRQVPARVRFLSVEPLLEDLGPLDLRDIDWVIVGGESGPEARRMREEWALSVRDQCQVTGVAFTFKQWGTWGLDGIRRDKKTNGRLLAGRLWDARPEIAGGFAVTGQLGGYGVDDTPTVVIITTMNSADLIKELEKAGWTLRGVKGSHHIYTHPARGGHLSVPHPKKDLGAGLVCKLRKQAGLI